MMGYAWLVHLILIYVNLAMKIHKLKLYNAVYVILVILLTQIKINVYNVRVLLIIVQIVIKIHLLMKLVLFKI